MPAKSIDMEIRATYNDLNKTNLLIRMWLFTYLITFIWRKGQINMNRIFIVTAGMGVSVIFCAMMSCLIEIRRDWWRRMLLLTGCWLLIFMVLFTGDLDNLPPTLLFFLFCVWNACSGSKLKRLTVGAMLASVMFALNALFDNCIGYFIHNVMEAYSPYYFVYRALAVSLLYTGVRHYRPEPDFELSPPLWRLLLILCVPPMGIVCSLILFNNPTYRDPTYMLMDTALFLVAAVSFVGILWAMLTLNRQQKLERENALAEHNKKYYEAMEQQQFEVRRIRHDLANHLQLLLSLPAEDKDSYIRKMIENPAFERVLSYSGDATVNAVLTAKESRMRQCGISFHAKVDIPGELPFEKPDLCALFANVLDNAVEACASLGADQRQIELNARAAKGILAVEARNPFEGQLVGSLPGTTKTDTENHGFGLRSVQQIVKKYGGSMELRQEEGWFCLFCYMPFTP